MKRKGFTLIELLIVITLLGILAVAVLSAINPIEQINRSRDTATRSDAEQLLNAIDRFYATQGYYPWQTGASDTDDRGISFRKVDSTWVDDNDDSVLDKLTEGGTAELKESFINRITEPQYNHLYIYNGGTQGDSTYVCFVPKSGAFETESQDRCNPENGGVPGDYPGGEDDPAPGITECDLCSTETDCDGEDPVGEDWVCLP